MGIGNRPFSNRIVVQFTPDQDRHYFKGGVHSDIEQIRKGEMSPQKMYTIFSSINYIQRDL